MTVREVWFRHGHRWVLTALCLGAILAEALDALLPQRLKFGMEEHAPMITVILVSMFILAYLERDGTKRDRLSELGIENIYRTRVDDGQFQSYQELLSTAKHELFIVGITLKDLSREQRGHLLERASAGCSIDLLMLAPKFRANKDPILDPVAHVENHDLTNAFSDAIAKIRGLAQDISKTKGKLCVRFYETAPTLSLTVKDGRHSRGRMHVEIVPHQVSSDPFRPILDLSKDGTDELFSDLYKRYRALWDDSRIYLEVDPFKSAEIKVDDALDRQISKWLGLDPNWRGQVSAGAHT